MVKWKFIEVQESLRWQLYPLPSSTMAPVHVLYFLVLVMYISLMAVSLSTLLLSGNEKMDLV